MSTKQEGETITVSIRLHKKLYDRIEKLRAKKDDLIPYGTFVRSLLGQIVKEKENE